MTYNHPKSFFSRVAQLEGKLRLEILWMFGERAPFQLTAPMSLGHSRMAPTIAAANPVTFLDLPEDVRAKIYRAAGLVRPCWTWLSKERKRLKLRQNGPCAFACDCSLGLRCLYRRSIHCHATIYENRLFDSDCAPRPFCNHDPFPISLLAVCRTMHHEASNMLYGENCFYLDSKDVLAADYLSRMSGRGLASLRRLHISYDGCGFSQAPPSDGIKLSSPRFEGLQASWKALCRILSGLQPHKTFLSFFSHTPDVETVRQVLAGFAYIPALKRFAIHVYDSDHLDLDLSPSGRAAAHKMSKMLKALHDQMTKPARDSQHTSTPFPFLLLPDELQLSVLSYTGVVQGRPYHQWEPLQLESSIYVVKSDIQRRQFSGCCGTCDKILRICSCNKDGAYSSGCSCQQSFPRELLAVNRHMRALALSLTYQKNELHLRGDFEESCCDRIRERLASVPPEKLVRMGDLVLRLPRVPTSEEEFADMEDIFERLGEHADASRLWLKIYLENWHVYAESPEPTDEPHLRRFRLLVRDLKGKYGLQRTTLLCRASEYREALKSDTASETSEKFEPDPAAEPSREPRFVTLLGPPTVVKSEFLSPRMADRRWQVLAVAPRIALIPVKAPLG